MKKNVKSSVPTVKTLQRQVKNMKTKFEAERKNSMLSLAFGLGVGGNPSNMMAFGPLADNSVSPMLTVSYYMVLSYMFKSHGILQTALEAPVLDALRGGLIIESEQLGENVQELQQNMEDEDTLSTVARAIVWKRLFGGAGLVINAGQDPESPLSMKKIQDLEFYAASRWELGMERLAAKFNYYGKALDASRVLTMAGKEAPYPLSLQLMGWGMSDVEKMIEDFNRHLKTNNVLYELLEEAKIDVFQFEGVNELLIDEAGTEQVQRRVETMNKLKNFNKALMLDKNDLYEQKQISSFAGIAEIMKENRISIAGATRIPYSKLFGTTAGGGSLANSSQDDIENYNALVESEIRAPSRPVLRKVVQLKCAQLFGLPDADFKLRFNPLRVLGAVEEEAIKTSKTNRYKTMIDMGIMERQKAAQALVKEGVVDEQYADTKGLIQDEDLPGAQDDNADDKGKKGGGKDE